MMGKMTRVCAHCDGVSFSSYHSIQIEDIGNRLVEDVTFAIVSDSRRFLFSKHVSFLLQHYPLFCRPTIRMEHSA
jgi:hypothetical protein